MTTMATFFKRFALWKAQEGATVAELEQYQASVSLPGTLKMVVLLRAFSWTSAGLVLLWSWFYIGSQAVSHEYSYRTSTSYKDQTVVFPSPEAPSVFQMSTEPTNMDITTVNAAFLNAIQAPTQVLVFATDTYNSALIPLLDQYSWGGLRDADRHGWRRVDQDIGPIDYTANSGIPAISVPSVDDGNMLAIQFMGTYTMSVSYIWPQCSNLIFGNESAFPSDMISNFKTSFNATNATINGLPAVDFWARDGNHTLGARCALGRQHVDVQVECDAVRCGSTSVRATPGKTALSSNTPFTDAVFSKRFFENLLIAAGIPQNEEDAPLYLWPMDLTYDDERGWVGAGNHDDVAAIQSALSHGLSYPINTYLCASQPNGGLRQPANSLFYLGENVENLIKGTYHNVSWGTAKANGASYAPGYVIVIHWLVLDCITCGILLIAAIASVWLRKNTVCPDVFGYISSMTRDNPNIPLPEGGSTMSGVERARAMKRVRVKIGEVRRPDGLGVGHIGLAMDHPEIQMDRLRRKGEYL
jgi:hypothetical protein